MQYRAVLGFIGFALTLFNFSPVLAGFEFFGRINRSAFFPLAVDWIATLAKEPKASWPNFQTLRPEGFRPNRCIFENAATQLLSHRMLAAYPDLVTLAVNSMGTMEEIRLIPLLGVKNADEIGYFARVDIVLSSLLVNENESLKVASQILGTPLRMSSAFSAFVRLEPYPLHSRDRVLIGLLLGQPMKYSERPMLQIATDFEQNSNTAWIATLLRNPNQGMTDLQVTRSYIADRNIRFQLFRELSQEGKSAFLQHVGKGLVDVTPDVVRIQEARMNLTPDEALPFDSALTLLLYDSFKQVAPATDARSSVSGRQSYFGNKFISVADQLELWLTEDGVWSDKSSTKLISWPQIRNSLPVPVRDVKDVARVLLGWRKSLSVN